MSSRQLLGGFVLALVGALMVVMNYGSGTSVSCYTTPAVPDVGVRVVNVTNGGFVRGYVLAFEAPLNTSNVTVVDPGTGCSGAYVRRGELYLPVNLTCPFQTLWIKGLGNGTVRVYWQNPYTAVVLDTPEFVPIPGGFLYVNTTEYPLGENPLLEVVNPRGTVEILGRTNLTITFGGNSTAIPTLGKTLTGTPKLLRVVGVNNGSELSVGITVTANGTEIERFYQVPCGNWTVVRVEKGFTFTSLTLYEKRSSNVERCETTHYTGPYGPVLIALGASLMFVGFTRREE